MNNINWLHLNGDDDQGYDATYMDPVNPGNKINAIEMKIFRGFQYEYWLYMEGRYYFFDQAAYHKRAGHIQITFYGNNVKEQATYQYFRLNPPDIILEAFRNIQTF